MALFGCCCPPICCPPYPPPQPRTDSISPLNLTAEGMFDNYPIGRTTTIGVSSGFWTGAYGGTQDGVALLTNAQKYDNSGTAVGSVQPVVRVPMIQGEYVS